MITIFKKCSLCGVEKELQEFNSRNNSKTGKQSRCKECQARSFTSYYQQNRDKYIQRTREWRERQKITD